MSKRPACKVAIAFIIGIIVEKYASISTWYIFSIIALSLIIFFLIPKHYRNILLYLGIVLLGMLRYGAFISVPNKGHIIYTNSFGNWVEIRGWIKDKRNYFDEKTKYTVELTKIWDGKYYKNTNGRVLVNRYIEDNNFRYGQEVYIKGRLLKPRGSKNPGEFNYAGYLRNKGIFAIINLGSKSEIRFANKKNGNWFRREIVEKIKFDFINRISKNFSGQEKEILKGLLLGEREGIDPDLKEQFAKSGIFHILAVSGLHVGFVIFLLGFFVSLLRFPKLFKIILVILGIVFYASLTGSRPPVVRASLIYGIVLLGFFAERRIEPLNSIGTAGLILLLFRPDDLFSASFQLSFAAVSGIIFITSAFEDFIGNAFKYLPKSFLIRIFKKYIIIPLIISFGVILFISPFSGYYFSRLSFIAVILNLIVIPTTGVIVGLGFYSLIVGYFIPNICEPFNIVLHYLLKLLIFIADYSNKLIYSYMDVSRETVILIVIFCIFFYLGYKSIAEGKKRRLLIYLLLLANILILDRILFHRIGEMRIIFFDVGQGDSALITFPDNKKMLIDGGDKRLSFDAGEYNIAPYLKRNGIKFIDWVVITHPESDHIGGIPFIIKNFKIGSVLEMGVKEDSEIYKELENEINAKNIPRKQIFSGMRVNDSELYRIYILHPTKEFISEIYRNTNNFSIVIKIVYGESEFLFTGDIESFVEEMLMRYNDFLQSDVLKVSHHGSKTSTSSDFLSKVKPKYAVIPLGEYNIYNFPDSSVISRLKTINTEVIRTDLNGSAVFTSAGKKLVRVR